MSTIVYADRVGQTSTTTGTGTYSMSGSIAGFQDLAAIGNGNQTHYLAKMGNEWEVGLGTVTVGVPNTLARTKVYDSSNAGAAVSWAAGTKSIYIVNPAARYVGAAEEVTVGSGGDYSTIGAALEYLGRKFRSYEKGGIACTVRLLTGFQMQEEVHLVSGEDLSWIDIVADDATVTIVRSSLATAIGNTYNGASFSTAPSAQLPQNTYSPWFGYQSKLPRLGCLFDMDGSGSTTINVYGMLLHGPGAGAHVLYGCGVKDVAALNASYEGRGLSVNHGAVFTGWGSIWSGCDIGARISNASIANLRSSTLSGCRIGLDANGASFVTAQDSDISACTQHALYVLGSSVVKVSSADMSGNAAAGSVAAGYATIRAIGLCVVDAQSSDISGGQRGIQAEGGAQIMFDGGTVTSMAGAAIYAIDGARVTANDADITGCASEGGIFCGAGGHVIANRALVYNNGTYNGLYAAGGKIEAYGATVTGNGGSGGRKDLFVSNGGEIIIYGGGTTAGGSPQTVALSNTNVDAFGERTQDGVIYAATAYVLRGSKTHNFGSLADGAGETTTVTCTGAALGDFAEASLSVDLQGLTMTAYVSAADTVSVRLQNESGSGPVDLASATLRVRVRKA